MATPKRRDFSDCFTLGTPGATATNGVDDGGATLSRLSRIAAVARTRKVACGAIAGPWDVRTRWSGMTQYFGPGAVRRRTGSVERVGQRRAARRAPGASPTRPPFRGRAYRLSMSENVCYVDAYARSIEARLRAVEPPAAEGKGALVLLDRTVFYPGGGGQPADRGVLRTADGMTWHVVAARKVGDEIWHELEPGVEPRRRAASEGRVSSRSSPRTWTGSAGSA